MKLAIEGGDPWAWRAPIRNACSATGSDIASLFAKGEAWAKSAGVFVPDGDHAGAYRDSCRKGNGSLAVPAHMRRYLVELLGINKVVERIEERPRRAQSRTTLHQHFVGRRRKEPFFRPMASIGR